MDVAPPGRFRVRRSSALAAMTAILMLASPAGGIAPADGGRSAVRGPAFTVGEPPAPPFHRRVVFLSDSALAGIRWSGQLHLLTNAPWDAHLESCRRLVAPSCRGREGRRPLTVVDEIAAHAGLHGPASPTDFLVVAVGHNDWEGRFRDDFRTVIATARQHGFRHIAWLTYRSSVSYQLPSDSQQLFANYAAMNAVLYEEIASGRYPDVQLWDYGGYTADRPEWYTRDGVHVTSDGAAGVARWLSSFFTARTPD